MDFILSKATFGILSSLAILIGGLPYLNDIRLKRIKPHVLSWLGWGFITAIGAFAMLAEGSTWAVALVFANTVMCTLIALAAIITRTGVWSTGIQDFVFFGVGLLGIILWQTLDLPILALICAILADLSFGVPTIIKTFRDPSTETPFAWVMSVVGEIFGLLALSNLSFHEVAYPIYLFIYDSSVVLIIYKIIKKSSNKAGTSVSTK